MDIRSAWAARPEVPEKETRADKTLAALVALANRSWSQFGESSLPRDEERLRLQATLRPGASGRVADQLRLKLKLKNYFLVFAPPPPPSRLVSHRQQDRSRRHSAKDRSNDSRGV